MQYQDGDSASLLVGPQDEDKQVPTQLSPVGPVPPATTGGSELDGLVEGWGQPQVGVADQWPGLPQVASLGCS